jgi:hypothetical protein
MPTSTPTRNEKKVFFIFVQAIVNYAMSWPVLWGITLPSFIRGAFT